MLGAFLKSIRRVSGRYSTSCGTGDVSGSRCGGSVLFACSEGGKGTQCASVEELLVVVPY